MLRYAPCSNTLRMTAPGQCSGALHAQGMHHVYLMWSHALLPDLSGFVHLTLQGMAVVRMRLPQASWAAVKEAWDAQEAGAEPVIWPILEPANSQKRCRLLPFSFFSRTSRTSAEPFLQSNEINEVRWIAMQTWIQPRADKSATG